MATPIGNLEDITLRALRILKGADLIFAEDTRIAKKLISHFEIKTPIARRHTRDEQKAAEEIIVALDAGKNIALISDAGKVLFGHAFLFMDKFTIKDKEFEIGFNTVK